MVRDRDQVIYIAGHRGMVGSALVRRLTALRYTNLLTASHAELGRCRRVGQYRGPGAHRLGEGEAYQQKIKMDYNPNHAGLEGLLDLDGEILVITEAGHWVKIEARVVAESDLRPHGLKYALTFHGPDNRRILGYDNGHGIPQRYLPADHRHRHPGDEGQPYRFISPERLLQDFFRDVDAWLEVQS